MQAAALSGRQCLAATDEGLWRSTDTCRTWTLVKALAHADVVAVVADTKKPGSFFAPRSPAACCTAGDGGAHLDVGGPPARHRVVPGDSRRTPPPEGRVGGRLGRHPVPEPESGKGTWQPFDAGLPPGGLAGVVVDPATGDTIGWGQDAIVRLAGSSSTWEDVRGNFPSQIDFQVVVVHPQGVVAFTAFGAFVLDPNPPAHWSDFNSGVSTGRLFLGAVDGTGTAYAVGSEGHIWKRGADDANWSLDDSGVPAGVVSDVWSDVSHAGHVLVGTAAPPQDVGQGPLWRSVDGGTTWAKAASGIQAVQPTSIAVDPHHAGTVLAGTVSDGVERSTDGGKTWRRSHDLHENEPLTLVLDPAQPNIALATTYAGGPLERSTDGGVSWSAVAGQNPSEIAFDVRGIGWELVSDQFERSADGGKTWTQYAGFGGLQHQVPAVMVPDEAVPGALFAGLNHGVYRLPHKGDTWGRVGLAGDQVFAIAVDGADRSTVYAGAADGVWRSTNDGLSWHHVLSAPATRLLATAPGHAGVVYASTPLGVRRSGNGGTTWKLLGSLGERPLALAGAADGRTVFAATSGLGVEAWTVPA